MRVMVSILMLLLVMGCASRSDVPLPTVTRFDDNPKARAAYLEAFRQYYRASMAGHPSMPGCTFGKGGAVATAREDGAYDGLSAADKARLQQ